MKIFTENIDQETLQQIYEIKKSNLFSNIRIMPDTHASINCVVGFTAMFENKLPPSIIGTDIGCGMLCVKLGKVVISPEKLDKVIKKVIPNGQNICEKNDKYYERAKINLKDVKCYIPFDHLPLIDRALGTLGGGNHFIELDRDNENNNYLIIHTGSRNLGKRVYDYYSHLVKHDKGLPTYLDYLEGEDLEDYLQDVDFCNKWAKLNRETIAQKILDGLNLQKLNKYKYFHTLHNYINGCIVRKGAIAALDGKEVIIPLNMRDGSLLCEGLGNEDWNYSAPHGAGRRMSRAQAKKCITLQEYRDIMENVYSSSINEYTIDESPLVYKDSKEIESLITPTVKIIKKLKPIYNYKNSEK